MRARLVPALVAMAVLAVGCSDGEEPDASPTLPPITEAPSESPTAEAVPSEATAATPEGAAEFVRFFYEQLERAYLTRDTTSIAALSDPACETCQLLVEAVAKLRETDATVEGFEISVIEVEAPAASGDVLQGVLAVLSFSEYVETGSDGAEAYRAPAEERAVQNLDLRRSGESWVITAVTT